MRAEAPGRKAGEKSAGKEEADGKNNDRGIWTCVPYHPQRDGIRDDHLDEFRWWCRRCCAPWFQTSRQLEPTTATPGIEGSPWPITTRVAGSDVSPPVRASTWAKPHRHTAPQRPAGQAVRESDKGNRRGKIRRYATVVFRKVSAPTHGDAVYPRHRRTLKYYLNGKSTDVPSSPMGRQP